MATSINLGFALWMDGATFSGLLGRTYHVAASFYSTGPGALQVRGGVLPHAGQLAVTPGSGMAVNVAAGACIVANSSGATYGGYLMASMSSGALAVAPADTTFPRIDAVVAQVTDNGDNTSFGQIQIITGTPGMTPQAPPTPVNGLVLVTVTVPANATSLSAGNIAPLTPMTVAAGGVLPVTAPWQPAGYNGALVWESQSGAFKHNSAAGLVQAKVLPQAPVMVSATSNLNVGRSAVTVLSLSFTADGATNYEYTFSNVGVGENPDYYVYCLLVDGVQVWGTFLEVASGGQQLPFFMTYYTSGSLSTTPSAGTHTLTWTASADTSGGELYARAGAPMQLRAAPVSL